ncbi:TCAF factor, partial [Amia calva]|nr:TCAF factor [Amia calva]
MDRVTDYTALMKGIDVLDFRMEGIPSDLVLTGEHAFPLAMNERGQVLMAASRYGKGRVVALGHEVYLEAFPTFVENALVWLKPEPGAKVGIHKTCQSVWNNLCYTSEKTELVDYFQGGVGVYITTAYESDKVKEINTFLKEGGGLLIAGQAWHWSESHKEDNTLLCFPGNQMISTSGIYFSQLQGEQGVFPVPSEIPTSWLAVSIGKDFKEDLDFLLNGVDEFDIKGSALPSEILVHGPLAFPIAMNDAHQTFFAGAYYGQGRVIATSHEGFLGRTSLSKFLNNALRWLDEGRNGVIGFNNNLSASHTLLSQGGLNCVQTDFHDKLSVYVCTSYSNDHAKEIQEFVAEGGGLLIGGHAWYWCQSNRNQNTVTDYPGNQVIGKFGLNILGSTITTDVFKTQNTDQCTTHTYHFRKSLQRIAEDMMEGKVLEEHEQSWLKKLGNDCSSYLRMKATHCSSYTSVLNLLTDMLKKTGVPQACDACPLKTFKEHFLLKVSTEIYEVSPDPDSLLPIIIKDIPQLPTISDVKVQINGNTTHGEEWKSTGLYLSPGMKSLIEVPSKIVRKGCKVQIGCQTDFIGNADQLKRAPCVHQCFSINSEKIEVSNLWGGLLYLVVPNNMRFGDLEIKVDKAVRAPYYKSGQTSREEWLQTLRGAPSPWAEMEFDNIIITVSSELVRGVDNPEEVAKLWNQIMKGIAELANIPQKFPRKERFVADVQISHGFMHAGYPIMMHSTSGENLFSPDLIKTQGLWGCIHELGHNQQRGPWEFPPHTTECTCNLWAMYVHETVLGIEKHIAHPALQVESREKRIQEYLEKGRNLNDWSVWTALETYIQLQEEFGWDAFKKVFGAYHQKKDVPKDNKGKMNLFTETFSKTVNKNLAPFFKSWGWPIENHVEKQLQALPEWKSHPMTKYA